MFLDVDGEKIHGWWVPSSSGSGPLPVILHFHGNAGAFILCWLLAAASYSIHHAKLQATSATGLISSEYVHIDLRIVHYHTALSQHLSTDEIGRASCRERVYSGV